MSFPKFVYMTQNTPFFPILHVFAPLNAVRAHSAWSWKITLITWIFGRAWYPPWHSSGPPRGQMVASLPSICMTKWLRKWRLVWRYVCSNTKNAESLLPHVLDCGISVLYSMPLTNKSVQLLCVNSKLPVTDLNNVQLYWTVHTNTVTNINFGLYVTYTLYFIKKFMQIQW